MSQMKFLLLLIFVDLGSNKKHPRWEFVGEVENDEDFWKNRKSKMLFPCSMGTRFRQQQQKSQIGPPKLFFEREIDFCKKKHSHAAWEAWG